MRLSQKTAGKDEEEGRLLLFSLPPAALLLLSVFLLPSLSPRRDQSLAG